MTTFDDIAETQGWGVQSQLSVLLRFVSSLELQDTLDDFAQQVADRENQ